MVVWSVRRSFASFVEGAASGVQAGAKHVADRRPQAAVPGPFQPPLERPRHVVAIGRANPVRVRSRGHPEEASGERVEGSPQGRVV